MTNLSLPHPGRRLILALSGACLALFCALSGPGSAAEAKLRIFAAASLKGALDAALVDWSGAPVVVSYGGSAAQARQVAMGAPADLVILAHPEWMDWLAEENAVDGASRRDLLGNRLVVVAPADRARMLDGAADLAARLGPRDRIAMGAHRAVPAGQYARQWLQGAGMWEALRPRLAETENVRAALALVALGEAPLGVVYATDALAEPRVRVVYEVPAAAHDPIRYPAALTARAAPGAAELLDWLTAAGPVFAAFGFVPTGDA